MKLAVAFLLGMVAMVAIQGKTADWITGMVRSYHMERKGYEEQNYGIGIERSLSGNTRLAVGVYRNSERSDSAYGAGVWCPARYERWVGCGLAGAVTGYSSSVAPLAGLVLAYEGEKYGFNILALPNKKGDLTQGVLAFQVKFRW